MQEQPFGSIHHRKVITLDTQTIEATTEPEVALPGDPDSTSEVKPRVPRQRETIVAAVARHVGSRLENGRVPERDLLEEVAALLAGGLDYLERERRWGRTKSRFVTFGDLAGPVQEMAQLRQHWIPKIDQQRPAAREILGRWASQGYLAINSGYVRRLPK